MGQGSGAPNPTASKAAFANHLYCKLCDVVCSSADAYAAHMRGSKHQRVGWHTFLWHNASFTKSVLLLFCFMDIHDRFRLLLEFL